MDILIQRGVELIIAIQSLGGWLEAPMRFFTFLGTENFFLLVLPLIYWCVDAGLGLRVGMILITSNSLNDLFKLLFAGPRPYWVSAQVKALAAETSFGIPSGHAQNAMGVWGIIAGRIRKSWAWAAAFVLAFLIGFSRLYLGVHFPHDVIIGWLIGGILLWAFMRFWDPVAAWLKARSFTEQLEIAFAVSMILILFGSFSVGRLADYVLPQDWIDNARRAGSVPDPVSMTGFISGVGTLFGLAVGAAWIESQGGYQAQGPIVKRVIRFVVGLIGVVILLYGLDMIFPDGDTLIPYLFRYLRYALVGFWVLGGAPGLFFRFKLAEKPNL